MSTNWLQDRLRNAGNIEIINEVELLTLKFSGKVEKVYCPASSEYKITADVVEKANGLGATIIAHATWCGSTVEGKEHAKHIGLSILGYASLFAYLTRKGVRIPS